MAELKNRSPWLRFVVVYWQVILGAVLISGGFAALFLAWWGVSGSPVLAVQMTYVVSGGLGGLAGVVLGAALLIVFHLQRQNVLLARMGRQRTPAPAEDTAPIDTLYLVPKGATRYHRSGCMYVEGKPASAYPPGARELSGLQPCSVCEPTAAEA
jgi:hypothetical protein